MKRALKILIVIFLFIVVVCLSQTAVDPDDFTGHWFSSEDHSVYLFRNGLIYCPRHSVPISDADSISGAYCYGKDRVYLFAKGIQGLENGKELYLIQKDDTSILCDSRDGSGVIYFARSKNNK